MVQRKRMNIWTFCLGSVWSSPFWFETPNLANAPKQMKENCIHIPNILINKIYSYYCPSISKLWIKFRFSLSFTYVKMKRNRNSIFSRTQRTIFGHNYLTLLTPKPYVYKTICHLLSGKPGNPDNPHHPQVNFSLETTLGICNHIVNGFPVSQRE